MPLKTGGVAHRLQKFPMAQLRGDSGEAQALSGICKLVAPYCFWQHETHQKERYDLTPASYRRSILKTI
jgi:hypothetical protein